MHAKGKHQLHIEEIMNISIIKGLNIQEKNGKAKYER